ncbi:uncharacterized protein LOC113295655 [Papaver somniferum]|uniref:uncharacterized protein LOC113295655 n=1 Tax=Papaver somniferum TaxID=3469 RepID=UPI000E6FA5C6|nr:uncharacterized protein LOC113295655 [Papaver somniferum]
MNSFSYRLPFSLFFLPQLRSNPNLAEISTKTLRMIKIKRFTSLFLIRLIHAFSGLSGFPYKISEPNQNTISSASRTGTFTAAEHGWCRTFSAEEAEAVAMLKATQWADRHNIQNLIIKRDNQATISYLQGKTNSVKWQCIAVLEEVKVVAAKLVSFKGFQYVDRRANNKVADLLAKDGRRSKNTAFWSDQAPNFLFPAIAFDTVKAYELCNSNETTFVSCSAIVNPTNSVIRRATQHKLVSEESELAD